MSSIEALNRLTELQAERAAAIEHGLAVVAAYMDELESEIAQSRHAYVGAAVTDIANLRAWLSGPLAG